MNVGGEADGEGEVVMPVSASLLVVIPAPTSPSTRRFSVSLIAVVARARMANSSRLFAGLLKGVRGDRRNAQAGGVGIEGRENEGLWSAGIG